MLRAEPPIPVADRRCGNCGWFQHLENPTMYRCDLNWDRHDEEPNHNPGGLPRRPKPDHLPCLGWRPRRKPEPATP